MFKFWLYDSRTGAFVSTVEAQSAVYAEDIAREILGRGCFAELSPRPQ